MRQVFFPSGLLIYFVQRTNEMMMRFNQKLLACSVLALFLTGCKAKETAVQPSVKRPQGRNMPVDGLCRMSGVRKIRHVGP
jgi:hypothetical protein